MEVISVCPLKVASLVAPRAPGVRVITVVCKGTFTLAPGQLSLSPIQRELSEGDDPSGKSTSVRVPTDVGPKKPRAEVLLVGSAFAPSPARSVVARVAIGAVDKALEVHADRALTQAGELVLGKPFSRMPLTYERAAGGPGTWNPLGVTAGHRDGTGLTLVPNVQPVGFAPSLRTPAPPVGFGPLGGAWPARAALAGGRAAELSSARFSAAWSDAGVDPRFYQAAPADQQLDVLAPGEMLLLEGLSPNYPELVMRLPDVVPRAVRESAGRPDAPIAFRCDTLWIDTDASVCTLTWRGEIELVDARDRIKVSMNEQTAALPRLPSLNDAEPMEETVATGTHAAGVAPGPAWLAPSSPPSQPTPKYVAPPPLLPRVEAAAGRAPRVDPALDAARAGVLAASNAAARARAIDVEPSRLALAVAPIAAPSDVVELLWSDTPLASRLRRTDELGALLKDVAPAPRAEDESPEQAERRREARRRREVLAVLRRATPLDASALDARVIGAMQDGTFTPPLAVVDGALELTFDPLAELRATLAAVFPFSSDKKKLKELVDTVTATLAAPFIDGAGSVAAILTARLREGFAAEARGLPANYVDQHVERAIIERREFQTRKLFGRTFLRGALRPANLPVFLPSEAEGSLPLFRRIDVRAVVEVHLRLEEHEGARIALVMLAVGRVTRLDTPKEEGKRG